MIKRNIIVERVKRTPVEAQEIEIVERKGIGHPDSLADGIADAMSRALCRAYKEEFGAVLHHNTDQVEIVGGRATPRLGGGRILNPIYVLLSGRATTMVGDELVPVNKIAIHAAKEHLRGSLRNLDVNNDVIIDSRIGQGSTDLIDVFKRKEEIPLANDTSFGVSFAPFSETEEMVYETEKLMNSDEFKKKFPGSGEDIKVMGLREKDLITLTISDAMVSKYIPDIDHYRSVKDDMQEEISRLAAKITERDVCVMINTADNYDRGSLFLTVTGTSAEMGDDGSVGRGNRVNGLITMNRYMSMEAAAGKNPINHVGKIYNLLSLEMARNIDKGMDGVKEVYVKILSQIGSPIDQPKTADIQLLMNDAKKFSNVKGKCESIADQHLADITKISEMFIAGELTTF
ncbi:MAG: methionine adenosyltransferase [Candidatus Hydrothermarchaeota archaeon]|nr:methionine adenosyltransferase [Candidatus Hydrothermarchaeota archaeon]